MDDVDGIATYNPRTGEYVVAYEGIGALFITFRETHTCIEAVAIANPDEPRPIVVARHEALTRRAREIFGEGMIEHDPLGLRGGPRAVAS